MPRLSVSSAALAALSLVSGLAACGSKPPPTEIPMLPGDGDTHVAKPPPPPPPPSADQWTDKSADLIPAPTPVAPTAVELPKLDEYKLANGLTVYTIKRDRLPVISLQLAIRAGRMQEPRARLGVSELTADMLIKGTSRRDAVQLARAIDAVGGTIAADATFEATLVSCNVMSKSLGTCLELLPEMTTQPTFPDAEIAKLRDQLIGTVHTRMDDPATLASAHAQNLLWGNDHVRGWINSEQSIGVLHRDDILAWYSTWFVPENAMLIVVGDFDAKRLRGDLERAFGGWRKKPVPPMPSYPEQGLSGSRIRLVDKPGLTQTQIRIAQYGIKHEDPRFFDTLVWNYALGGSGPSSRLARALRDANAKAGAATSSFDRNLDRGSFVVSAVARNSDAIATAKTLLAEIAKMAKDGPTADEVAAAIAGITGGYSLRFQQANDFGSSLVGAELHSYGQEYLTNFPVAVGGVTVDDAKRAAGEILDPKAYVLVLVGDAKDLEPQLKKQGWRYEKLPSTEIITPVVAPPELPIDPKASAAAHKIIDDALAAKGGKAKIAALKALKMTAAGTTTIQGQALPVELSRVFLFPDKMRIDATIQPPNAPKNVVVSIGVNGPAGWQEGPGAGTGNTVVTDITGSAFASIDFERWREPELILLKAADPTAKLAPGADDTLDGKPCSVVKLRSSFADVDIILYIEKKSRQIIRMTYSEAGNEESDDFADYRDVGGIKIAHHRVSTGGGRSTTLDVKSVELDPTVDPKIFDKPAAPAAPAPAPAAPAPK